MKGKTLCSLELGFTLSADAETLTPDFDNTNSETEGE